ncbi:uncharacterized protein LOC111338856 isoform X2 [Stylophora pistillata]|uniref:uncharacterized protein LOC111338856 isoform X2 n=1 Tax=Stylophora pistillata TaxID=50429 RepID=UPI000C03F508|nr:uncharacterized protein LOC111338856 isoform X2 [Stylophora pistillata]
MDVRGHLYESLLLLAILSSPAYGDYIDHLDQEEGTDYNATGVKIVIVYGVVLAIQSKDNCNNNDAGFLQLNLENMLQQNLGQLLRILNHS